MFHLLLAVIYLAFISLGLPDALLGSAWPSMYPVFHVPVSYSGIISMIIAAGTVISSLQNDRLTKKLGTDKITAMKRIADILFFFIPHPPFCLLNDNPFRSQGVSGFLPYTEHMECESAPAFPHPDSYE